MVESKASEPNVETEAEEFIRRKRKIREATSRVVNQIIGSQFPKF